MSAKDTNRVARIRRHTRIRKKVAGTSDQPRLAVFRSPQHIYAQVIDDRAGRTLAHASDLESALRETSGTKTDRAREVGTLLARRAKEPFKGANKKDLGFQVTIKVTPEPVAAPPNGEKK